MSELVWSEVRDTIIGWFAGQLPRAGDEANVIRVFETHPQAVMRAAEEVAEALAAGRVRYGWSVLAARALTAEGPPRDVTVPVDRERQLRAAERWLANAGLLLDREREVLCELFDEVSGMLRELAAVRLDDDGGWLLVRGDAGLVQRMLERWRAERPRGVAAEEASAAYFERLGKRDRVGAELPLPDGVGSHGAEETCVSVAYQEGRR